MLAVTAIVVVPAQAASVLDLQPYRLATSVTLDGGDGRAALATLTSLHPGIDRWYLLTLDTGTAVRSYHLENPLPLTQSLSLDNDSRLGLVLTGGGAALRCALWREGRDGRGGNEPRVGALDAARSTGLAYAPLCNDRLYLRNPAARPSRRSSSLAALS